MVKRNQPLYHIRFLIITNNSIQVASPKEVGITKETYTKQVFDIARKNGDKVAIDASENLTQITWARENHGVMFGVKIPETLSLKEQAYEAAKTYNLTLGLGIAEPNIS